MKTYIIWLKSENPAYNHYAFVLRLSYSQLKEGFKNAALRFKHAVCLMRHWLTSYMFTLAGVDSLEGLTWVNTLRAAPTRLNISFPAQWTLDQWHAAHPCDFQNSTLNQPLSGRYGLLRRPTPRTGMYKGVEGE